MSVLLWLFDFFLYVVCCLRLVFFWVFSVFECVLARVSVCMRARGCVS